MSSRTPSDNLEKIESAPKKKHWVAIAVVLVLIFSIAGFLLLINRADKENASTCNTNPDLQVIKIRGGDITLTSELVEDSEDQAQGLSGRNCLDNDRAMLFAFKEPKENCFWMKDMNFSIDIVWLDEEKKIVMMKENASPESYPDTFCPSEPTKYVVEVNSGTARKQGWETDTQFSW